MKRFRGGLVVEAQRLLYHSTLGSRVIKKKKKGTGGGGGARHFCRHAQCSGVCVDVFTGPAMGTSPIRKRLPLGPYSRAMPRDLWRPYGGWLFLMSEVPR